MVKLESVALYTHTHTHTHTLCLTKRLGKEYVHY